MDIGRERRTIFIEPIETPAPAAEPASPSTPDPESDPAEEPALAPDR
jgi:hypothetical protein